MKKHAAVWLGLVTIPLMVACDEKQRFGGLPVPLDADVPDAATAGDAGVTGDVAPVATDVAPAADSALPLAGPMELARRQGLPTGVAVNATAVFWANEEDGTITTCPLAGCPPEGRTVLASGQTKPRGVAVDATTIYWVAETPGPGFAVRSCPLAGCGMALPTEVMSDSGAAYGLAVDADELYVAAGTRLLRCPRQSCSAGSATVLAMGTRVSGVAVNATHFYYVRASRAVAMAAGVYRCPRAGCGPRSADEDEIGGTAGGTTSVAIDDRHVYWTEYADYWNVPLAPNTTNRIARCPLAGCQPDPPTTVTSGEVTPWGVALDGQSFYWTEHQKGRVIRTPKAR